MKLNRREISGGSRFSLCLPQLESFDLESSSSTCPISIYWIRLWLTDHFYPKTFGKDYKLDPSLVSLEKHKSDFTMINNLIIKVTQESLFRSESYLTGADVLGGTPGKKFHNSISVDQVAAPVMGRY